MEDSEKQKPIEKEAKNQMVGILLTAGAQEKDKGGHRIEPDLEGKVRAFGALDDLANGNIDRLFIVGGATAYNQSLASHYEKFLRRFVKKIL